MGIKSVGNKMNIFWPNINKDIIIIGNLPKILFESCYETELDRGEADLLEQLVFIMAPN